MQAHEHIELPLGLRAPQVTAFQSQPAGASDTLLQSMNSAELEGLDDHTRSALRSSAAGGW